MPELPTPNPALTKEQALTMILSSIAMEEVALSHIINAEGEKIQYILNQSHCGCSFDPGDILAVNKSVTRLLEMVMQNQLILKNKMERVLEYLPKPPSPPIAPNPPCTSPCPPCSSPICSCSSANPSCPPVRSCASPCTVCPPVLQGRPDAPQDPHRPSACFCAATGSYPCGSFLQWSMAGACGSDSISSIDSARIQLPRGVRLEASLFLELSADKCVNQLGAVELLVNCGEKRSISKLFYQKKCPDSMILSGNATFQLPNSCSHCSACVIVRAPHELQVCQGVLCFTHTK